LVGAGAEAVVEMEPEPVVLEELLRLDLLMLSAEEVVELVVTEAQEVTLRDHRI
jgi:hypothetical protein